MIIGEATTRVGARIDNGEPVRTDRHLILPFEISASYQYSNGHWAVSHVAIRGRVIRKGDGKIGEWLRGGLWTVEQDRWHPHISEAPEWVREFVDENKRRLNEGATRKEDD